MVTAVDAKYHSRPIDVKHVEAFIGLLRDVGVDRGIMLSPVGYTEAALTRAFRDDVDLDLDVFTLAEFKRWQVPAAIPFAGRTGVVIPAPLGWVLEIGPVGGVLARLYRRGRDYGQAYAASEFMYVQIWDRDDPVGNLDQLVEKQSQDIRRNFPDAVITESDLRFRSDYRTRLRRAEIATYPAPEITGYIEFPKGILFVVLFSPLVVERRNLRKLDYVLRKAIPVSVEHAA